MMMYRFYFWLIKNRRDYAIDGGDNANIQ